MALEKALAGIIQTAEQEKAPVPGDYRGEDGLWYCGRCPPSSGWGLCRGWGKQRWPAAAAVMQKSVPPPERNSAWKAGSSSCGTIAFDSLYMQNWNFAADDGGNPALKIAMEHYVELLTDPDRSLWRELILSGGGEVRQDLCGSGGSQRPDRPGDPL